jgi:hypothetical protein
MSQRRAATRTSVFADLERMDAPAWASHLAPDAVMRLGNGDPGYGRDGSEVTLPQVTIYRTGVDGLISDYRVYGDVAPVLSAPTDVAGAASAEFSVSRIS